MKLAMWLQAIGGIALSVKNAGSTLIATYRELIQQYDAPKLKSPYNLEAQTIGRLR